MRIGIVGCGAVTEQYQLPALSAIGSSPVLLVDTNAERAETLAATIPGCRTATSHSACVGQVDAAIVAVPHTLHAPVCTELLSAGIHVLVEKPMATTTAECDQMLDAARRGNAVVAVGLFRRFRRTISLTQSMLKEGVIGSIRSFDIREGGVYDWAAASPSFFRKDLAGGGVLLDTGAHTIDLLLALLGDWSEVSYRDDSRGGIEANCELHLVMESGAQGVVELSRSRQLRNTIVITGSAGHLELGVNGHNITLESEMPGRFKTLVRQQDQTPETFTELFQSQLRDWLRAIRETGTPRVNGHEARRSVALMEHCYDQREPLEHEWDLLPEPLQRQNNLDCLAKQALVTGATGFIGGRLVEVLLADDRCRVRALVRNFSKAPRLARHDVDIIPGDLSDPDRLLTATRGCDTVFHCAHHYADERSNIADTRRLADACIRNNVRRLVYLSSVSAYQPFSDGALTEESPYQDCESLYTLSKRAIEEELLRMHRDDGLRVVILQPTVVYGPFGGAWTNRIINQLQAARVALPTGGTCNPVYVDDVVQAMLLASTSDAGVGHRFLVSGPDTVSWREFYTTYESILGLQRVVEFSPAELDELIRATHRHTKPRFKVNPRRALGRFVPKWVKRLAKWLVGSGAWERIANSFPLPMELPSPDALQLFRARSIVQIDKARRILKYEPAFSFGAGMQVTQQYLRWAYEPLCVAPANAVVVQEAPVTELVS